MTDPVTVFVTLDGKWRFSCAKPEALGVRFVVDVDDFDAGWEYIGHVVRGWLETDE